MYTYVCLHMQARLARGCAVSNRVMQPATHSWVHSKSRELGHFTNLNLCPKQCVHTIQRCHCSDSIWQSAGHMHTPVGSCMSVCAQISRQSLSAPFSSVTAPQGKPAAVSQTAWLSKLAGPWNDSVAHRNVDHSKVSNHSNQSRNKWEDYMIVMDMLYVKSVRRNCICVHTLFRVWSFKQQ